MLCSCDTHKVTKKRAFIAVLSKRQTERHGRDYCARTTYQRQLVSNSDGPQPADVYFRLLG